MVARSGDALTTAIVASTATAYAVNAVAGGAATSYIIPSSGIYYIGIAINTSNAPTVNSFTSTAGAVTVPPILAGTSDGSLTTPHAFPYTPAAITPTATIPLMWVS